MREQRTGRGTNERGAMLVQVALSIGVLMSLAVFVIDYGVVLTARGQAQNAADAGALAGAISRAYDEFANPPAAGGQVELAARGIAAQHRVSAQPIPAATVGVSYACPPGVTGGGCVRVDVYRNGENGSAPLPVFFGPLLGVTSQGVRATATAQALSANAANCIKPWAVMDRWQDAQQNPWTQASIFTPSQGDTYDPANGFSNRNANDEPVHTGYQMALKMDHPGAQGPQTAQWGAGWALRLDLPNDENGNDYFNNISGCTSATVGIAPAGSNCNGVANPPQGCLQVQPGGATGPTISGVDSIVARDSTARWDRTANGGAGAIAGGTTPPGSGNPRVVPIALVNPQQYVAQSNNNGQNGVVQVVNIIGFFIEGTCPNGGGQGNAPAFFIESYFNGTGTCVPGAVVGRLMTFPGTLVPGATAPGPGSFGQVIRLVR